MHNQKPIVVQDACILLDLIDLHLLEAFFRLDLHLVTTQFIVDEIKQPEQQLQIQQYIAEGALIVDDSNALMNILALYNQHSALTMADCSVLEVALRTGATILSTDGGLRKIAKAENCIIHGTIWILEELQRSDHLTVEATIGHLENYLQINIRAPVKEIGKAIHRLRQN